MDLAAGRLPGCQVVWLEGTHGDLGVTGTVHRPLVDVGRPDDDVLIIN
jgi:hypothetical protein